MVKTAAANSEETIEKLQLRLIEVEAQLDNPTTEHPLDFWKRERPRLMSECDVIKAQISFLETKLRDKKSTTAPSRRKRPPTKQEIVYKKITAMIKRSPNATKANLFEKLADEVDMTEAAVKKAFYDYEAKQKHARDIKARQKRDSERDSDQRERGEK